MNTKLKKSILKNAKTINDLNLAKTVMVNDKRVSKDAALEIILTKKYDSTFQGLVLNIQF